ncbi:MAG: Asp23/Gls24 family envelope stress response protein [Chloroflexi bacterium]|nr:Asp23/Gls24 family envelope stress response protein [Chloroflexota bacterium]
MSPPTLAISHPVIRDLVRLAAIEVPGVLRVSWAGSPIRRALAGRPVVVRLRHGVVEARVVVVARPGQPLAALAADVRTAVAAAIERLLGLDLGEVTVRIDGIGG